MRLTGTGNSPIAGRVFIDDAFWNPKLALYFGVTLPDTLDKLERDGAVENLERAARGETGGHRGPPWLDGLLMETVRGASDYLRRGERDDGLKKRIESYARAVKAVQDVTGGYVSTYTLLERPDQRFGENGGSILWQHDLYNNGCLIEAGVHHYLGTGSSSLLDCAVRCANQLSGVIGEPPGKWIVPGHELPSYALIELIELFRDHPALAASVSESPSVSAWQTLAHFWIHGRGHHEHRTNHPQYMGEYAQDHAPIESQVQAVGHAVRATLYYTGVTRLAMLEGDRALLEHSLRLWDNVTERKLHVNGGVGATHFEEKFGEDYDLVNTAYLETCASVGLIFWAEALSRAVGSARFFSVIERALYNLMLSSVSLDGRHYFYRNPLLSDGSDHHWAWHGCPCCPPMFHKTFGRFDRLAVAQDDRGVLINLHVGCTIDCEGAFGRAILKAETALPWKGSYRLTVQKADRAFSLRLRVPEWAESIAFFVNGQSAAPDDEKGYAVFTVREGDVVAFEDPMPVRRIEAHPYVRADRDRVAIARGPLIYCLEGVDNPYGVDVVLPERAEFDVGYSKDIPGGAVVIHGRTEGNDRFTAVPLAVWDNRMAGAMNVWLRQRGKKDVWDITGWKKKLYRTYHD